MPEPTRSLNPAGRPNLLHALLEAPRALVEASTLAPSLPLLLGAPRGDGHTVLVMPGFLADDASTTVLRAYLSERGYDAHGWGLGRNRGTNDDFDRALMKRAVELHEASGSKVSLVGWSLGGVYALRLARANPNIVRQVVSMGSPLHGFLPPRSQDPSVRRIPLTSIYSRTDGIVPWQASRESEDFLTENLEVRGSHIGLGFNPTVLYAVADRLAQPEGGWRPFERSGLRDWVYPN